MNTECSLFFQKLLDAADTVNYNHGGRRVTEIEGGSRMVMMKHNKE